MENQRFYLVADYVRNGVDMNGRYEMDAPTEGDAVESLLLILTELGYDVKSFEELKAAEEKGFEP